MASTPWHLLTQTMDIYAGTWKTGDDGVPVAEFDSNAISVQCNVQPTSASDALIYGRDATTKLFDVYCAPITNAGAAWNITPKDKVIISGVQYRVAGQPRDLITMGTVYVVTLERDQD